MQYLVIWLDGNDAEAVNRRLAMREEHIKLGDELLKTGNMWYGAAIKNDDAQMIGSALFMDFDSEEELNVWLKKEPYIVGKVWESLQIHKCSTRDPWQFNRTQEWFKNRSKK